MAQTDAPYKAEIKSVDVADQIASAILVSETHHTEKSRFYLNLKYASRAG